MGYEAGLDEIITSEEQLRELVGQPHEAVVKKSVNRIDDRVRAYLGMSPLFFLATANGQGQCDVSPRGDHPGFVQVLDERTLAFPERPGNKRIDSMLNILSNPRVGMICLIPGLEEVLRVNGKACIIRNEPLLDSMQWNGKTPPFAVKVEVEECFVHCPRAFKLASVWQAVTWPAAEQLPNIAEMFKGHLQLNGYKL